MLEYEEQSDPEIIDFPDIRGKRPENGPKNTGIISLFSATTRKKLDLGFKKSQLRAAKEKELLSEEFPIVAYIQLEYVDRDGKTEFTEPFERPIKADQIEGEGCFVVIGDKPEGVDDASEITRRGIYTGVGETLDKALINLALVLKQHNRSGNIRRVESSN